ncbi:MAG: 30S ribosomal protein S17 [bacterium]
MDKISTPSTNPSATPKGTQKTGVVVSKAGIKTVIVKVDSYIPHPLYKKRVRSTKRFAVHDEQEQTTVGDTVTIGETRPLSKTKRWRVLQIVKARQATIS